MTDPRQLLADYVASGSETAFRDLVASYVNLVYSAAIRLVNGDTHRAEDVAQTVFADLAKLASTEKFRAIPTDSELYKQIDGAWKKWDPTTLAYV